MIRGPRPDSQGGGLAPNGKPYESVWDFPRPPAVEWVDWRIRVVHAAVTIVDAPGAWRVLETSQPPAYYVEPGSIDLTLLVPNGQRSHCEWKGTARYADVRVGGAVVAQGAWSYPTPTAPYVVLAGCWAFYPQRFDQCRVDDEVVVANPGQFYGGWITRNVTGPFKGAPGTMHW